MAYDESLSSRIDDLIKGKKGFTRQKMFGGIGFLLNGNMCVGVHKNDLLIRHDPGLSDELNSDKHVKPFAISGKPMKGWSLVSSEGVQGNDLKKWFDLSFSFVKSLPPKK
jgi:hypothetical protein